MAQTQQLQNAMQPGANPMAPTAQAAPGQDPGFKQRYDAWMAHLGSNQTRAALMQFGVQMLQPRAPGQTIAGHVGEAIAGGGQAAGRISEMQRLTAKDQRDERRLDQTEVVQNENLRINREQLDLAKGGAQAAAAQQVKDNEFKEKELAYKTESAKALTQYRNAMASRPTAASIASPPGYDEALGVLATEAEFAEDPLQHFMDGKALIDAQFGLTTGGGKSNGSFSTAAEPPVTQPRVGEVREGWKFKGGDPSQQSSWEKAK